MTRAGRVVAGVLSACVVVAAAYGAVFLYSQHEARAEIDAALAALPPGTTAQYRRAQMSPLTRTVEIDGLTVMRHGAPAASIDSVRLREGDGDGSATRPWRLGALHLRGVSLPRPGRPLSIDRLDAEDLVVLAPDAASVPAGVERFYQPAGEPRLVSARRVEADTLAQASASVTHLELTDLAPGRLGSASLDGLTVAGAGSLAHAAASGVAMDALDAILEPSASGAPGWSADRPLLGHLELDGFASTLPNGSLQFDTASLDGLSGHPLPEQAAAGGNNVLALLKALSAARTDIRNLAGSGVAQTGAAMRVTLASLHDESSRKPADGGGQVVERHVRLRGLAVPLSQLPPGTGRDRAIAAIGAETMVFDVDDDQNSNSTAQTLDLERLRITLRGNFALQLVGHFDDVDPAQAPTAALAATAIGNATLRYEDGALLGRLINGAAMAQQQTPEQVRAQLHARVSAVAAQLLPNQADAGAILDHFIDQPGTLTLRVQPPSPVTLLGVAGTPGTNWAAILGATISAD